MNDIGTLAWALRTHGHTSADDEAFLAEQIPYILEQAALPATADGSITFDDLTPPNTSLTRDATQLWHDTAPAWLTGHGHRTWYYAAALDQMWGAAADRELLYVACLLHDLGLTSRYAPNDTHPCFAVSGAHGARPVVAAHRNEHDADTVFEAIAMHLNLRIDHDGPVQRLVPAGTLVDVTGLRLQHIPAGLTAAINHHFPRASFGTQLADTFGDVADRYPSTRCGWLERTFHSSQLIRDHPLDAAQGKRAHHVLIVHEVLDYSRWKQAFDDAAALRSHAGEQSYQVLRDQDVPDRVVHFSVWTSTAAAKTFFESPELVEIRRAAGVHAPEFLYLDEVESATL